MRYSPRLPLPILILLTAASLGPFAKPAVADTTGFLSLINTYRQQNGLGTLTEDQNLTNAACWFAADLAANNPTLSGSAHTDSQGRSMGTRLSDFGVGGSRAENLFYTSSGSAATLAFNAWKGSPGHNTNMLNGVYTRIGIGRVNSSGKWYWVTDFANGSATGLSNQCGATNTPPPPPPPAAKKPPPPPPPPPPAAAEIPTVVATPVATTTATIAATPVASKSATKSARVLIDDEDKNSGPTLVQGITATTIVLANVALFGVVVAQLYRKHRFFK